MFRTHTAMNNDMIARYAPSIFANAPSHRMSDRYGFIPTAAVLSGLQANGWNVVSVGEQRVRLDDRRGVQKHQLRLRRNDMMQALNVGDSVTELVLTNSHDGTSAYELTLGLFRKVCSNGLHVAAGTVDSIKVRHSRKAAEDVVEGSFRIIGEAPKLVASVDAMRSVDLTEGEQSALATAAIGLRWEAEQAPIEARQLLQPRRWDDSGSNLWSTFNRIQENMIKGGLRGTGTTGRRTTTREVNAVDANTKLNRSLWTLAEEMRKLKNA